MSFENFLEDYRDTVRGYAVFLETISDSIVKRKPNPSKWSAKEILGHLIDSASNNHQRFVRAQAQTNLVFEGYEQDNWVHIQDYQNSDWKNMIALWKGYNLHLADVMQKTPIEIRHKEHRDHNLCRIAWKTVNEGVPTTLEYFMKDYVGHLKHHLSQIDTLLN